MIIFKQVSPLQTWLASRNGSGESIGFVPTMGALHQGHLSLIEICKSHTAITVASIFVNPTQFNNAADFEKYPSTISKDVELLEAAGCDVLFLPSVDEIYPGGTNDLPHYALGSLEEKLEGFYRPGHFQGVCQVVHRLLDIVHPDELFMGQKDFQQCMVVRKLIELTDMKIQLQIVPTIRETNGLAMSSRNMRLSEQEKVQALSIYRQLQFIKNELGNMPINTLVTEATAQLLEDGFSAVDYISIAEPATLEPLTDYDSSKETVILIAAFLHDVRLIDNLVIPAQ